MIALDLVSAVLIDPDDPAEWLARASSLSARRIVPERVHWSVAGSADLFAAPASAQETAALLPLPDGLRALLRDALYHSDPGRHALSYRLLWRMQSERGLADNPADPDMIALRKLAKAVRRDIHKMHAFVRFRKVSEGDGRERFAAWFEPDHFIERRAATFFARRFAGMDWAIVTPRLTIVWDGEALAFGPGGSRADVPSQDAVEAEWRGYYTSIFNPARLKVRAMKSEMPVKYWRNLPEAPLISGLIDSARNREEQMVAKAGEEADLFDDGIVTQPVDVPPPATSLDDLYTRLRAETALILPDFSDRLVLGEGPDDARILVIGEQPGDVEDQEGRPFVGPAGAVLDHALNKAGLNRERLFLTNAVKRFKFVQRGKRRLHQTPNAGEIAHYRWWLAEEIRLVAPKLVIALGGTAAQSVLGKPVTISRLRGEVGALPDFVVPGSNAALLVTVHPSYLLRLPDREAKKIEYHKFVRDLRLAEPFS